MRRFPTFFFVVEIGDDGIPGKRLEGQRRDEFLRVGGHNHTHIAFCLGKQRCQIRRLVRGNGAGDAEDDLFRGAHAQSLAQIGKPQPQIRNQKIGAAARRTRIFSASKTALARRRSSAMDVLMIK